MKGGRKPHDTSMTTLALAPSTSATTLAQAAPSEITPAPRPTTSATAAEEVALDLTPDNSNVPPPAAPKFSLHPDDPKNFLKLSMALTIFSKKSITTEEISFADSILREYLSELITAE